MAHKLRDLVSSTKISPENKLSGIILDKLVKNNNNIKVKLTPNASKSKQKSNIPK